MRRTLSLSLIVLALVLSGHAHAQAHQGPVVEVAFVLDTTGSMGGLIEGAKQKIWSIASKIASAQPTPTLRVGLVGYRDKGDAYVTRSFDLTEDLDGIYEHLQAFQAQGGGDTPEHVGRALGEAVSTFSWSTSSNAMKMIFLVGDAPPQVYQDGWDYRAWAKNAIAKGVVVNTVRCGPMRETGTAFKAIANLAQGSFTTIDASGGMVAISTPYDTKIEELNRKMAGTAIYGGLERAEAQRKVGKIGRMKGEAAANRVKYNMAQASSGRGAMVLSAKSAGRAKDLVAEPQALEAMAETELPESLRKLSKRKQRAQLKALSKTRKALAAELKKVTKQRDTFVAKKVSEKTDSFDAEVMKQVKKRGKDFGLKF
jgi:hypothetical protein